MTVGERAKLLSDLNTRDSLRELAANANVTGRSSMNKQQLARALAQREV